jgi:hypothetical protein
MSRSGYSDDCDNLALWRGAVVSAIKGKRGRQLLSELASAMDAMPIKELIANELQADGSYCALGVVGAKRGLDMSGLDPDDADAVAETFGVARALAREIVWVNDDEHSYRDETPAQRWTRVRKWVADVLADPYKAM